MIKLVKKMGETLEESRLVEGALIDQKTMGRGGPTRMEKANIGLIQFQLSPPKTDVSVSFDYYFSGNEVAALVEIGEKSPSWLSTNGTPAVFEFFLYLVGFDFLGYYRHHC